MSSPLSRLPRGAVIGVVHLLPLPGAPTGGRPLEQVLERARADARALVQGGAAGAIVENLGDAPYSPGPAEPHVLAVMAVVARELRGILGPERLLGINVLRNDALGALGVALAAGADFVRVNVHTGAMVTDQGILQGRARETLLYRRRLGLDVGIAADVAVKHAVPLGPLDLVRAALDTWERGGADALIVTGEATGSPPDPDRLARLREALPGAPLWLGSGLRPDNAARFRGSCDAAIVGTYLHRDGRLDQPLEPERVRAVVEALAG